MDELDGPDPDVASFGPVPGFAHILSDTPLIASMVLEPDGPWRDLAPHILSRVTLRLDRDPAGPLTVLLPDRVIDPPTPPWVAMRRDFMAGRLRLDPPGKPRATPKPGPMWGPHPSHCCATHWCKYGDLRCPVVTGKVTQDLPCGAYEMCEADT